MRLHRRLARAGLALAGLALTAGCTTTSLVIGLVGVSTDTSIPWAVAKHVHAQLIEGEPRPCIQLNSVQRALSPRCGDFVAGSIVARDIDSTGFAECPLGLAARDPRLWPVLPELLRKGASTRSCPVPPLLELARAQPCPDFGVASVPVLAAARELALGDPRSVHHDVMRMLSCPRASAAGLDTVLDDWWGRGWLQPGAHAFSPLGALHPHALGGRFSDQLEQGGHKARDALGSYNGRLSAGFEEALRTADHRALDWWFARLPGLVREVPPKEGNQLPWLPLARVLVPSFLEDPQTQRELVDHLLSRGADPRQRLPANPDQSVQAFARQLKSPVAALLDPSSRSSADQRMAVMATEGTASHGR